ncbi:MAG: serine protein kinase RIO, partial [Nanoarchaeota archaeon]|nr:serine protein kinase RIO [Nanoarchaeota archaeon]
MFKDIISNMKKLHKAGLVHADLSGFNILNMNKRPVFIDFSQATPTNSMRSMEYLKRDIKNICVLFRKNGVDADEEEVFKQIVKRG